jgi:hypothetical protein
MEKVLANLSSSDAEAAFVASSSTNPDIGHGATNGHDHPSGFQKPPGKSSTLHLSQFPVQETPETPHI